ncbi:hypothetical protein CDAR_84031 [Caerostris darwini]|uniref:Uncharacterized protein n=1 Tax=Caerostris darwini TaxID=1538125 RepID=A0AAV4X3D5_9ARAC|nr:hypothetical protein CDAR_84031 [Caerostris darwini]
MNYDDLWSIVTCKYSFLYTYFLCTCMFYLTQSCKTFCNLLNYLNKVGSRSDPHGGGEVPSFPGQHWCTASELGVLIVLGWGCDRNTVHLSRVPSGRAIESLI